MLPISLISILRLEAQENQCECGNCEDFTAIIDPANPCLILVTPVNCTIEIDVESWNVNGTGQNTQQGNPGEPFTLKAMGCGPNLIEHLVVCENYGCTKTASTSVTVTAQEISISAPLPSSTIDCHGAQFDLTWQVCLECPAGSSNTNPITMLLTLPPGLTMSPGSLFLPVSGSNNLWQRVIAVGALVFGACLDVTASMVPLAPGLAAGNLPVSLAVSASETFVNGECGLVDFPAVNFSNPTTIIGAPGTTTTTTAAMAAGLMPSGFVTSNTRIYGNLMVDNVSILGGWSVAFGGAAHRMGAGASITVNSSCVLSLSNNAHFFNDCGLMWRGTTIQTGSTVRTGDFQFWGTTTTIEDAVAAFEMRNNSTLLSQSAIYRRNFVGVFADLPVGGSINLPGFANNRFECLTTLNSRYLNQPPLIAGLVDQANGVGQRSFGGVVLRNLTATNFTNQVIGSYTQKNWFNTLRYGVYLLNCQNLLVLNNVYTQQKLDCEKRST